MKKNRNALYVLVFSTLIFSVLPLAPVTAAELEEIRIGYTAPFTGAAAEFGNNGWRGILLALEDVNREGISIGGKPHRLKIIKYDSACSPDEGISNVQKMVTEDRVVAILGDHCSTVCNVIAPLCDYHRIPGITIECAVDSTTNPGHDFYFRMRPTVKMMIPAVMPKVFKAFNARTAAFLVVNDEYGRIFTESVENELKWRDVKTVARETFERGNREYWPQLARINRTTPDLLFYVGTASEGATLLKQARELGMMPRTKFIGSEEMGEMELLLRAGAEAVEGTYAISLWGEVPPEFKQRVIKSFNKPMHYGIIFGYDALKVLTNAIRAAQSTDPVEIKEALKKTDYRALEGHVQFKNFGGYRNQSKFTPSMIRWEQGKRIHLDIFVQWEG